MLRTGFFSFCRRRRGKEYRGNIADLASAWRYNLEPIRLIEPGRLLWLKDVVKIALKTRAMARKVHEDLTREMYDSQREDVFIPKLFYLLVIVIIRSS